MGFNKAFIEIDGEPIIRRLARIAGGVTDEVLISANAAAPYAFVGLPVIGDRFPGQGPLAGLHAAMLESARSLFLLLACDLPDVSAELLQLLVAQSAGRQIVVPRSHDGRLQPLCAIYRRSLLPEVESRLQNGRNRIADLCRSLHPRVLYAAREFKDLDFLNWNSSKDLLRSRALGGRQRHLYVVGC